jgi:hypothetical protein
LTSGGANFISLSWRSMRLLQPESAIAGNCLIERILRWVTVGSWIRDTRDDRIDSERSFQSNSGDDISIDCKGL